MSAIRAPPLYLNLSRYVTRREFSTSIGAREKFKLVVVGGGAGGISVAAKFASKLGKSNVAVIEPSETHYYQPYWTLVGAGLKDVRNSARPMSSLIPNQAVWIKDKVQTFSPDKNCVITAGGKEVSYEFLVIAVGLTLHFEKIKGLQEAFETPGVCSNYSFKTVTKTLDALKQFKEGNAIFTLPNTPIKCAGAPQKIMYLADAYLRKNGKRNKANIMFNTSLGVMFAVPTYAKALVEVAKRKDIAINFQHNLIEVKPTTKEAVFEKLSSTSQPKETLTVKYEMLHVTPPMGPPDELKSCKELVDGAGYLAVDKHTLQHSKYSNVFGVGDCTSVPTSKTAAAVGGEVGVLRKNLAAAMNGQVLPAKYDGYTSCPLVTSFNTCIMAEFDFDLKPLETFPFDQSKERILPFYLKSYFMPSLYWQLLLRGYWEGPKIVRKIMHFGMGR